MKLTRFVCLVLSHVTNAMADHHWSPSKKEELLPYFAFNSVGSDAMTSAFEGSRLLL
jgi:hypothetical protein